MKTVLKSSDKKIGFNIYCSGQQWFQNRQQVQQMAKLIGRALPMFAQYMDLPTGIKVRICSFKSGNLNGRWYNDQMTTELSVKLGASEREVLEVLAHELVHAEQYKQGRLAHNRTHYLWNGVAWNNKGTTYAAYRAQPWEEEAFGRQRGLADRVAADLEI